MDEVTGERRFDEARTAIAARYCEVLSAEAAPAYQREAPRTLSEAMSRPDAPRCLEAQHEELSSLTAKQMYEIMMLPKGKAAIKLCWVFSYKLRPDGHIERYKARLVAKGFTQKEGLDYFEVWAPTGRLAAYCALLAHGIRLIVGIQLSC